MKKFITIISFVLIFCALFTSCGETDSLPSRTENFDEEFCEAFFEDYYLADAGLAYYKASFEIKIPYEGRKVESRNIEIMLGTINNTSQSQFVSAVYDVWNNSPMPGASEKGYIYVYQHKNAPHPMKDWNIESVSLISHSSYHQSMNRVVAGVSEDGVFIDSSENYMDVRLASSSEIKIFKSDNENDIDFIEGIKNAYLNVTPDKIQSTVHYYSDEGPSKHYYLLVKFKESSDIIWYTPLIISYDGFRICHSFYNYDGYDKGKSHLYYNQSGIETHYGTLSEEITNELYDILISDGWDPKKNNPVSPTTSRTTSIYETPEYTNKPVKDIFTENN